MKTGRARSWRLLFDWPYAKAEPSDLAGGCAVTCAVADRLLPPYLAGMKFSIGYFAKPRAPGIPPALLATYTGDFNTVDDARKAAIADADDPKIGTVDSITIDPIGERWVKGESLVRTGSGWERRREPE